MANFVITSFLVFCFLILAAQSCSDHNHTNPSNTKNTGDIFDVVDYGAAGDGYTDDTQAFLNAWEVTCKSSASVPTMNIPSGKRFLILPSVFSGGCNSKNVTVVIDGNIIAPSDPSDWKCNKNRCRQWLAFAHLDGLFIRGSGTVDFQGSQWWDSDCHKKYKVCQNKPTGFAIVDSNNVHLEGLTFKDSPKMQVAFESSTWVYASHLTVTAPEDSPNTDGIHIQQSQNVFVQQSRIGTGDDCISIGDGSAYVNINGISCGPGHGISIGSLGKNGDHETVEYVHVSDVEFKGTMNGARIKTWQGGSGYARNIVFERIISRNSKRPIIIDQYYCDHQQCSNHTSAVRISNITYSNIRGTTETENAVEFACSESAPCTNIFVNEVHIQSTKGGNHTTSYCLNASGRQYGNSVPNVACLRQT